MPRSNFFTHLGLLAVNDFLDAELCARLRAEMSTGSVSAATLERKTYGVVDEDVRRAGVAKVSADSKSLIHARLSDLLPRLESHFNLALKMFERPQFLIYQQGGFFTPHQDDSDDPESSEYIKSRKVSVVIFLNTESEEARNGFYVGGKLAFYGLMKDPLWKSCKLPLIGEEGLLIAFRSDVIHEVTPVTCGVRHTIVTWFY
jgi:SM-20-related protein